MPLLAFLSHRLGISSKTAKALLDGRHVTVNDARVWMARHILSVGDTVRLPAEAVAAVRTQTPVPILYRDPHLVIAAKPAGMLSCGAKSLETRLREQLHLPGLRAAHRLDRDTSGCLMFAVDEDTFERLVSAFRAKTVSKVYHALVHGNMEGPVRRISKPLAGQTAVSNVRVLDRAAEASHVSVSIETGRTHQIRIHLASIRHPVLGDRQYAAGMRLNQKASVIARQMLHAYSLRFPHPFSREPIHAKAALPSDFTACMRSFRLT